MMIEGVPHVSLEPIMLSLALALALASPPKPLDYTVVVERTVVVPAAGDAGQGYERDTVTMTAKTRTRRFEASAGEKSEGKPKTLTPDESKRFLSLFAEVSGMQSTAFSSSGTIDEEHPTREEMRVTTGGKTVTISLVQGRAPKPTPAVAELYALVTGHALPTAPHP
jgi:hypothetical protein